MLQREQLDVLRYTRLSLPVIRRGSARLGAPRGRPFDSGRRLFTRAHIGIFGIIRVRVGSLPSG